MNIYNIAIVAHVDHGKTTLVDALLKASEDFDTHKGINERALDRYDQEKERGITIYAKNASVQYKGNKVNIVDTPGHADFGSEVERVLRTVDAVLLVVDAAEGPMPQTKFVLRKSLELGHKVLVVFNKIDKPAARPDEVLTETFDLFATLGANDDQLDFPYMYAIAKDAVAFKELEDDRKDITPLMDFILEHVPLAERNTDTAFKMQPSSLSYDDYLGRIAIGRVYEGTLKPLENVTIVNPDGTKRSGKVTKLFTYKGMEQQEATEISAGDIVALAGLPDIYVGETISSDTETEALPAIAIDPPALAVEFLVNDSPFAGKEGSFVTSRHIKERLEKELETNVGLQVDFMGGGDRFTVFGRGEMHIAVLLETMRREGYEVQIAQPQVITREIDGVKHEPLEKAIINVPEELSGMVIQALGQRKGKMTNMTTRDGECTIEFDVPTRGLLGFRSEFIMMTKGEATLSHSVDKFVPFLGEIKKRRVGSMISGETGKAMAYSLWKLQERGPLFINPSTDVYEGMIIGEHNQGTDLVVNPLKNKKLTNVRASGSDEALNLTPPVDMTLERAIEYIGPDEYAEITPESIRIRKKYLTENERKRNR